MSNAIYKCDVKYILIGTSNRTCLENGSWSNNSPRCDLIVCPMPKPTNNGTFTPKTSYLYNETVKYQCDHGYEIARGNTSVLRCTENATWSHHTPLCVDINECHDKTDNCSRNESQTFACFNKNGGYICVCHDGWTGQYCENDINECNQHNDTCGEHATCTNNRGGYKCTCNKGFPSGDPKYHCFENIIISLETKGTFHQGNNEIIDAVPIKYRFPYFGVEYKFFRPAMNGFLSLGFQQLYDRNGPQTPGAWKNRTFGMSVVAPLWGNLNSENISGGLSVNYFENYIHYGNNDSEHRDLQKLGDVMATCYNLTHFDPRVAIVVTWKNVTRWDSLPASVMVFRENATMQAILVSDGVYSYIMFNYDRAQWSLQERIFVDFAAGFSLEDKTGHILADTSNYTILNEHSNCGMKGRWAFNVTKDDTRSNHDLVDEATCLQFHENQTIRDWYKEQMKRSYACPCDEVIMQFDYTYQKLPVESDGKTICYQSWFFMEGIKQECCFRYGAIVKMGTDGAGQATFEDDPYNITRYHDACCSGDKHLCRLYYDVIPPDDCSKWEPDDEGSIQRIKRSVLSYMPFGGNTAQSAYRSTSNILLKVLITIVVVVQVCV
ncbi:CUB and sushi domain-containing protein 1 [Mactra antiquata]